jgi:uncharacterized membrane protein YqiK
METLLSHVGLVPAVLGFFFVLACLYSSMVYVGGTQLAILERKYFGAPIPQGRVIAMADQVGVQARTLGPGLHFLIPFLYRAQKLPFENIPEDEVGLLESIDGEPVAPGHIFAKVVAGHNAFQDGEEFLKAGGQKGPQIQILPPGKYRINTSLFTVTHEKTFVVDKGQVGVVNAADGGDITPGSLLGKRIPGHNSFQDGDAFLKAGGQRGPQIDVLLPGTYRINTSLFSVEAKPATIVPALKVGLVTALDGAKMPDKEYVALAVHGHQDFQDGEAFLKAGGQRGPQLDVLRPGTYYINPLLFEVKQDDVAEVKRGQVAVIISNVGDVPPAVRELVAEVAKAQSGDPQGAIDNVEKRLDTGIEQYVVPQGFRGIQQEVAGPGTYYLNRRAFVAYIVDTTNQTIDWASEDGSADGGSQQPTNGHSGTAQTAFAPAKQSFNPLTVVSRDGFAISVSVKVVIRVRPDQAPYMVAKIGSVENLIQHVIHPMIDSSFRNQASSTSAMNFMQDRQEEQQKAEDRTRKELEKYHVELVSVLICQIGLPENLMKTQTDRIIADQQQAMYQAQQKAEQERIAKEKTAAQADQQKDLVTAEIGVKVAEQNRQKAILAAEGEGEALQIRAKGQGEATRMEQEGKAKGVEAVGLAEATAIEAKGLAAAKAYDEQRKAVTPEGLVAIEVTKAIADGRVKVTPDFLIQGGGENGVTGLLSAFLAQRVTTVKPPPVDGA